MIPKPFIAHWRKSCPWRINEQVEQDLIISRMLVTLFSDDFLRAHLAFRGGTALYKLYLNPAPRYSEDIDLVQIKPGPIKPILKRIGEIVNWFEEDRVVKQKANNNTIVYRFISEFAEIKMRLKIEINCREHFNIIDWVSFPFEVQNDWYSGKANITTYNINELIGTKLRALYQRKKGRDLFDLYFVNQNYNLDLKEVIKCFNEYMRAAVNKPPTKKQFLLNLNAKQNNADFRGDMEALLRPGIVYNQDKAFDWIKIVLLELM